MPQTYRDDSPFEVALFIRDQTPIPGGSEKVQAGDIVAVRKPGTAVGLKERTQFLWLRLTGLDSNEWSQLTELIQEGDTILDKRRYCIPLARLKRVIPTLDLARVHDPNDPYQPCMGGVDLDTPETMSYADAEALVGPDALAEVRNEILTRRLGFVGRLDLAKLANVRLFKLPDGSFVTKVTSTAGRFLAPCAPLSVRGLVFDKQTGRYL